MNQHKIQFREITDRGDALYPFETYRTHVNLEHKNIPMLCASYHWHPELEIIFVEGGELCITIETKEYWGKCGDIFFINSGNLHTIYAQSGKNSIYNAIVFDLGFLSFQMIDYVQNRYLSPLLSGKLKFPPKIDSDHPVSSVLRSQLQNILSVNDQHHVHYQLETKLSLFTILMEMFKEDLFIQESERTHNLSSQQISQIKSILSYIDEHYQEKIMLNEIASFSHLSPKYFSRYFKKQFGRAFSEYVNSYRIERSLPMLEEKDLSISDIALQNGFESLSYYVKVFKSIMGITPGDYRRQNNS